MAKQNDLKQRAFVREYLKDQNGKQAAIRAGYSKNTAESQASRLLRNAKVRAEIEKKTKFLEEKVLVTKEFVVRGFKEVAERCMQQVPVMEFDAEAKTYLQKVDEDGRTVWKFDSGGANKALECLGKHLGIFIEKHEHSGPNGGPIRLEDLVAGSHEEEDVA